jgi:type II secretory pathway component PulM
MSTHYSTDPWRNNLSAPRSTREAFGDSLDASTEEDFSPGEKAVIIWGSILLLLVIAYIYSAELFAWIGG